jgi:hypothetical protein
MRARAARSGRLRTVKRGRESDRYSPQPVCLQGLCPAERRSVTPEAAGSSPVAPVRSGPQRAAAARNSCHARRTDSLPVTFLLTTFAERRANRRRGSMSAVVVAIGADLEPR